MRGEYLQEKKELWVNAKEITVERQNELKILQKINLTRCQGLLFCYQLYSLFILVLVEDLRQ